MAILGDLDQSKQLYTDAITISIALKLSTAELIQTKLAIVQHTIDFKSKTARATSDIKNKPDHAIVREPEDSKMLKQTLTEQQTTLINLEAQLKECEQRLLTEQET